MARRCDECGKPLQGKFPLVYLAKKVQFDFGSSECEEAYARRHSSRPHGSLCDYCMDETGEEVASNPALSIRFGKYTVDFCCSQHRTKWFRDHAPQTSVVNQVVNFRLTLHLTDHDTFQMVDGLDESDLAEGCEAFDLNDLGDFADIGTGGIPVFTIIRLLSDNQS